MIGFKGTTINEIGLFGFIKVEWACGETLENHFSVFVSSMVPSYVAILFCCVDM